jgi:DNA-binding CsgD family transcriptional regulator
LLERALSVAPRGRERARVALQLGMLLESVDLAGVRAVLARALHEADGDTALQARIHQGLYWYYADDTGLSRRHARIAFRLAERTEDPRLTAETLALAFDRDFWGGDGIDHELARTASLHGTWLRRRQRKRQAREALERALAIFERLGAAVYADRARSELARIGGRPASSGGLTPSERRVAELVAEGKTNREVAATLVVAERTVESALTQVYRKLGVRSRTELARKLPTG